MNKVKSKPKCIQVRLTEDEYLELMRIVKAEGRTISEYIKRRIFCKEVAVVESSTQAESAPREELMNLAGMHHMMEEVRNSLCGAEDIFRQLNQDSLRIMRIVHEHYSLTKYLTTQMLPKVPEGKLAQIMSEFNMNSVEEFPERTDQYVIVKKNRQKEEAMRIEKERQREEQRKSEELKRKQLKQKREDLINSINKGE